MCNGLLDLEISDADVLTFQELSDWLWGGGHQLCKAGGG